MRLELLTEEVNELLPFLERIFQDGGKKLYAIDGSVETFQNISGYSGYIYNEADLQGKLSLAIILGNTGYVLRRTLSNNGQEIERFDYFDIQGKFSFSSDHETLNVLLVDSLPMDLTCPILNHFYNFLNLEYRQASEGTSQTALVHSIEKNLQSLAKSKLIKISILKRTNDPAILAIYKNILKVEADPVLKWEERQLVFENLRVRLNHIISTKIRAHKLSRLTTSLGIFRKNISNFIERIFIRPVDNLKGLLYRYSIGKVIWFFSTVKSNLGYSVALAVYGPFTYYFITMPMNPHAMQAVGKVRAVYLDITTEFSELFDRTVSSKSILPINNIPVDQKQVVIDSVSSSTAAPQVTTNTSTQKSSVLANIIYSSQITTGPVSPIIVNMGDGQVERYTPATLNILLSTDVPKVNEQTWSDRMSHFKQMQIAYEENIEYASRMGRLEQLETQYNFPMQVEGTWEELERYNNFIFKAREENTNLSAKMKQYLFNEINRTQQIQLYLWDRLARFILDQPYVMLDQDKEQKRSDYYVGRSFVFLSEMTNVLSWRYKDFKKPHGFDKIEALANFYAKARKEHGTVLKNLQANSDLFKQKDIYNTKEFRTYMKRQWEILYLQNAKAEEASNNGLNMYIWSTRNTVWVLQSIYSAKREELAMLIKRDVSGNLLTPSELNSRARIGMTYETLLHNLTLEYVGIRDEIMNRLGKDIESTQRMTVIENLKEFLSDREKLDGLKAETEQKTAGNNL